MKSLRTTISNIHEAYLLMQIGDAPPANSVPLKCPAPGKKWFNENFRPQDYTLLKIFGYQSK